MAGATARSECEPRQHAWGQRERIRAGAVTVGRNAKFSAIRCCHEEANVRGPDLGQIGMDDEERHIRKRRAQRLQFLIEPAAFVANPVISCARRFRQKKDFSDLGCLTQGRENMLRHRLGE